MLYVFNTWVVANLFHPFAMYVFLGETNGRLLDNEFLQYYFFALIFSFVFAVPALLVAWLLFYVIRQIKITLASKFVVWTFIVALLPLITWHLLFNSPGDWKIQDEELKMILPSCATAAFAILIRAKQFFNFFNSTNT